jgi:hypothetical protein
MGASGFVGVVGGEWGMKGNVGSEDAIGSLVFAVVFCFGGG